LFLNVSVPRFFVSLLRISLPREYDSSLVVGLLMFVTFVFGLHFEWINIWSVRVWMCHCATSRRWKRTGPCSL